MNLVLPGALHARPASLFVRVALQHASSIEVRKGARSADGKNILEVLALGAASGETIEIDAAGEDAERALAALAALVEENFNADLVPETGILAAPGIAIGLAALVPASGAAPTDDSRAPASADSPAESSAEIVERLKRAFAQVLGDLEQMVTTLPRAEAELFEPEIAMVKALEQPVLGRVAGGEPADQAVNAEATGPHAAGGLPARTGDLVRDVRDRLLDAYADEGGSRLTHWFAQAPDGELILVTEGITPSLVAAAPARVVGIVAASSEDGARAGATSHAAILARGRGIPLVFVAAHVASAIGEGETLVLDATTARPSLWVDPSEARVAAARAAHSKREREAMGNGSQLAAPLTHLPRHDGAPFAVRVNVGSVHDRVPPECEGIGLVRTELFFSRRARPPTVKDQRAMLLLVAAKIARGPVVARLFDAGGDKPLAWLRAPESAAGARGIDLLQRHPEVLLTQMSAMASAAERADIRLLIPLVRNAADIAAVRNLAPSSLSVGAMIESPDAVAAAGEIARAADFVCIGTNDLAALVRGEDRATALSAPTDRRVLRMVKDVVEESHRHGRKVTVCGEMAGNPDDAIVLAGLGVDAISVAPSRFAAVKVALVSIGRDACLEATRRAIGEEGSG